MEGKVALVVGVTGVVGLHLSKHLLRGNWKVYGISRRKPEHLPPAIHHVAVDLTDGDMCKTVLGDLHDVTYVFYTSWLKRGSDKEDGEVNTAMLKNVIDNLVVIPKHFVLVTGTKHYLGPLEMFAAGDMEIPFKEDQPRLPHNNFYYDQEDVVFDRSQKMGFDWSVARPHTIIGFAPNNQMNLGTSIAVYASICKHLNKPFIFPGGKKGYRIIVDASDVDMIAEHLIWEVTNESAKKQAFNVVNGDIFQWKVMWKAVATYFGVKVEEPGDKPIDMVKFMSDQGPVWDEIVVKHNLKKFKMEELASWWFVNLNMSRTVSCVSDMTKSRERGFLSYMNTEKSYFKLFDFLRENKYIP